VLDAEDRVKNKRKGVHPSWISKKHNAYGMSDSLRVWAGQALPKLGHYVTSVPVY
jgi:hypothetical protein